ncbi:hypothetical protein NDU88_002957 [Pleurodeles waltl]|uniref:Uncharacterized protein n=1 Tax=Pleurodeles waltl TaxID=8319 RepID=A0AAV7UDT4_PLEWA|nr:hypothetical protein NDU88_002957 [Pleurodeles waltl]
MRLQFRGRPVQRASATQTATQGGVTAVDSSWCREHRVPPVGAAPPPRANHSHSPGVAASCYDQAAAARGLREPSPGSRRQFCCAAAQAHSTSLVLG